MERKSLNRITAAVTALILTAGMTFPVFADEQPEAITASVPEEAGTAPENEKLSAPCGERTKWEYAPESKTLRVTGFGTAKYLHYNYHPVWMDEVETVIIEEGITEVEEGFFAGCKTLRNVTVPKGICSIDGAFSDCTSLKSVTLPDSIESLSGKTFSGCSSLEEVHLGNNTVYLGLDSGTEGKGEFSGCVSLESIEIPESILYIRRDTFNGCTKLKKVTIFSEECEIADNAFENCDPSLVIKAVKGSKAEEYAEKHGFTFEETEKPERPEPETEEPVSEDPVTEEPSSEKPVSDKLSEQCDVNAVWKYDPESKSLTVSGTGIAKCSNFNYKPIWIDEVETAIIEDGITEIEEGFFKDCKNLKNVSIADSVIKIDGAFPGCTSLKSITLPDCVYRLWRETFSGCSALEEVHLGNGMSQLGSGIGPAGTGEFSGCVSLEHIDLPDSVSTIESDVFNGCTALKSIKIPGRVETIHEGAFMNCTSLTDVEFNSNLYCINEDAFRNCTSLEKIGIPERVMHIDETAFADCTKLKEVTVLSKECIIEENSFDGCDPSLVIKAYKGSKAEKYAERLGIVFEALEEKVPTEEERKAEEQRKSEEAEKQKEAEIKKAAEAKEKQKTDLIKSLADEGVRGDITGDGIINVFDVMRYKRSIIEGEAAAPSGSNDINRDGMIDGNDASAVMSSVLGNSKLWSYNNMPKLDGAVLNSSLEAGFKTEMLGMHFSEALLLASEHSEKEAFDALVSGENDMIFSTGVTEEQKKTAEEAGVKLVSVPVAKEGLVFIVNSNNPVDSLTSDQIRDIYSGKITNWKEVGGNDEIILPYQRNAAYDSHKYLKKFMNGAEFAEPLKIGNSQALYDNSENALGYSVYSYAAKMYESSSDIKYIAVDGIKPNDETMKNGTYPAVSTISAVYTEDASENTKHLAEWALSEKGQAAVSEGGFIPVKDTEHADEIKPYYSKGTGTEKPADYSGPEKGQVMSLSEMPYFLSDASSETERREGEKLYSECKLTVLNNTELQDRINDDIKSIVFGGRDVLKGNWKMNVKVYNGYMNISFVKTRYPSADSTKPVILEDYITLNYDLVRGKKLEHFSDLFFRDEEYVPVINKRVSDYLNGSVNLRSDYLGMLGDITNFGLDYIVLDKSETYSGEIIVVPFHSLHDSYDLLGSMVISEYHDNLELIDKDGFKCLIWSNEVRLSEGYSPDWVENFAYGKDGKLHYDFFSRSHTASETEERNSTYESLYEKACILYTKEFPEASGKLRPDTNAKIYDPEYNDQWSDFRAYSVLINTGSDESYREYYFDPETKEQIFISDIFGKDFEKYDDRYWFNTLDPEHGTVKLCSKYTDAGEAGKEVKFSFDDVNTKYLNPGEASVTEFSRTVHGFVDSEKALVYPGSYVIKYDPSKKGEPVQKGYKAEIRNFVTSLGKTWYECWNAESGDYCGWIAKDDITLQYTEDENKLYSSIKFSSFEEQPIEGELRPSEFGADIISYTNESVMNPASELKESGVIDKYGYVTAKNRCLSHGKWLYECWSGSDYLGWIEMHDFRINKNAPYIQKNYSEKLASELIGTVPGKKYNGIDFYAPEYIAADTRISKSAGCVRDDIKIQARKRCYFHGELWYECTSAGDGSYYLGWVNGDLIEFE